MAVTSTEFKMMMIDEMAEYMPRMIYPESHTANLFHKMKGTAFHYYYYETKLEKGIVHREKESEKKRDTPIQIQLREIARALRRMVLLFLLPSSQQYFDIWICFIRRKSPVGKAAGQVVWTFYREKWNFSVRST